MFCPQCGFKLEIKGAKYCHKCGFNLAKLPTNEPSDLYEFIDTALHQHPSGKDSIDLIVPQTLEKPSSIIDNDYKPIHEISKQDDSAIHPWVRYFARLIDYMLGALLFGLVIGVFFPSILDPFYVNKPEMLFQGRPLFASQRYIPSNNKGIIGMIFIFIWVFIEAFMLSKWGTTPGKWLLRTSLHYSQSPTIPFPVALERSFSVWLKGVGIGFPLASLITLIVAYGTLTKKRITTWDRECNFTVTHQHIEPVRIVVAVVICIVAFVMYLS